MEKYKTATSNVPITQTETIVLEKGVNKVRTSNKVSVDLTKKVAQWAWPLQEDHPPEQDPQAK